MSGGKNNMIKLTPKTSTVISAIAVLVLFLVPLLSFGQTTGGKESAANSGTWFQGFLYTYVNVVFGWLVWATGNLLDYSIKEFVVGFGRNFVETGLGYSVNNLWTVIRDVFNLTFIFGLVFIGFKMILNNDSDAKRKLIYLILAALLVNFSLFITKFVIDFSNIAATQIAETFTQVGGTSQNPADTPLGVTNDYNVAGSFLQIMGLTSLWDSITGGSKNVPGGDAGWAYIIGTFILLLVCAFVFAAGAFLLTIRFVVLNIYMVLSPVMFLGWVFPGFSGASSKFWSGFLNRAFFAPAYLLMLYIAHHILLGIDSYTLTGTQAGMAGAFSSDVNDARTAFLATFPTFILSCAFMIAAIVVAQKMGAVGADNAMAMSKRFRQKAFAFGSYLPRVGTRMAVNSLGRHGETFLNWAQEGNGRFSRALNTNAGDRFLRGNIQRAQNAQFGTGTTNRNEDEYARRTRARNQQNIARRGRRNALDRTTRAIENPNTSAQDLITAQNELGRAVRDMTSEEKRRLGYDRLTNPNIALHLTDADIRDLETSGEFEPQQIADIRAARENAQINIARSGSDHQREALLAGRSVNDIGRLPNEVFMTWQMYRHITPAMLESKLMQGNPSEPERIAMRAALSQYLQINPNDVPNAQTLGANNIWVRWANSNSVHAAQFFYS